MTQSTRPPFDCTLTCRSNPGRAEERLERVRAGVQRRAERTALQIEKSEIDCSRLEQRIFLQRTRQQYPSAEMRAVNELRAQVAALAAQLGIAPWPPVEKPAVKTRKGDRRRGGRASPPRSGRDEKPVTAGGPHTVLRAGEISRDEWDT